MTPFRLLGYIWRWYTHPRPGPWVWLVHSILSAFNLCFALYLCPSWTWGRDWGGETAICASMETWGWTFIPILVCVWFSGHCSACACIELEVWLRCRRVEAAAARASDNTEGGAT